MIVKRILLIILFIFCLLRSFASIYYITTASVSIRSGAGSKYPIIYTLPKGEELEVLSTNSSWYQVSYAGETGYVYSKYLRYSRGRVNESSTIHEQIKSPEPEQGNSILPIVLVIAVLVLSEGFIGNKKLQERKLLRTVTDYSRGTSSERDLILTLLRSGMSADIVFHDLYVKKDGGGFAQIDAVVATDAGIIVFEVKDYSGWLYGNGNHEQWTKVLNYWKQKYRFYNPVKQNNSHIAALKKQLQHCGDLPFYSVIVFYGSCSLKEINCIPRGTFITKAPRVLEVVKTILRENPIISYTNKVELLQILKGASADGASDVNQLLHRENIKDMLGKHRVFK